MTRFLFDPSAADTTCWQRHKSHERESHHRPYNTEICERCIIASEISHHSLITDFVLRHTSCFPVFSSRGSFVE